MSVLILASQSPRRKQLLTEAGYTFEVEPSNINEQLDTSVPLEEAIGKLSLEKATAISAQHPEAVILAADTMVALDGKPIGKPADKDMARSMIKSLSGRSHQVITGFTIMYPPRRTILSGTDVTDITFRELTDTEIEDYVNTDEPYDKAGGYGIRETAKDWLVKAEGSMSNISGLPMEQITVGLEQVNIRPKG
jgi:septum formation protein